MQQLASCKKEASPGSNQGLFLAAWLHGSFSPTSPEPDPWSRRGQGVTSFQQEETLTRPRLAETGRPADSLTLPDADQSS